MPHDSLVVFFSCLIDDWFVARVSLILLQLFLCQRLCLDQMTLSDVPFALNGVRVLCKGLIKAQLTDSVLLKSLIVLVLYGAISTLVCYVLGLAVNTSLFTNAFVS